MIKNDPSTSGKSDILGSDILTVTLASKSKHSYLEKEVRKFSINIFVLNIYENLRRILLNNLSRFILSNRD